LGERDPGIDGSGAHDAGGARAHSQRAARSLLCTRRSLIEGLRNSEIAERLAVAPKTVDHDVSAILRKLDIRNRAEASAAAARLGIHQPA